MATGNPAMALSVLGHGVWYDAEGTGYVGLDLTADIPPPQPRTVAGVVLAPKSEYHCSLVALRRYIGDRARELSVAEAIKGFLGEHVLRFLGLGDERYLCRKDDRTTVVAPVRIGGLDDFVGFVRTVIPDYQEPFPHVTLLTDEGSRFGIAIHSADDLARFCHRLALPLIGTGADGLRGVSGDAIRPLLAQDRVPREE